jgi:hypothetical protein
VILTPLVFPGLAYSPSFSATKTKRYITLLPGWALVMSCPFPFSLFSLEAMGCCGINGDAKEEAEEEKRAKKTNKDIERQIQKDKQVKPFSMPTTRVTRLGDFLTFGSFLLGYF